MISLNLIIYLIKKLEKGLERLLSDRKVVKSISVVGGVSNNKYIKNKI